MNMQFNGFWQGLHQFVSSTNETENSFLTRVKEIFGREMAIENLVAEIYRVVVQEQYFEPEQTQEMQILIRQLKQLTLPQQLQERIGVISALIEIFPPQKRKQQEKAGCALNMDEEMTSQDSKKPRCTEQCPISLENRDVKDLLKEIDHFFQTNPQAEEIQIGLYFIPKALIEKIRENKILSSTDQLLSTQIIRDHEQDDVFDLNGFEKELLLQHSPVFHSLWLGGFKEARMNCEVPVRNAKGLKILIESLYRPQILKNHREDIFYLLHTAFYYKMNLCEELLK